MNQENNDQTGKWLQETVGNYAPDVPDDAWQRLRPHLPAPKRRRPAIFWWSIAAGLVTMMVVGAGIWKKETGQYTTSAINGAHDNNTPVMPSTPQHPTIQQINLPVLQVPQISVTGRGSLPFIPAQLPVPETQSDVIPALEAGAVPAPLHTNTSLLPALPRITMYPCMPPELLAALQGLTIKPVVQHYRFRIGLDVSPVFFIQRNTVSATGPLEFKERPVQPALGWQSGISLGFQPVKNWWISTGIQHQQETRIASHTAELRLNDGVWLNPGTTGLKEYEFQYSLLSGKQRSAMTLRLQEQTIGTHMQADEPFLLNMKTTRHTSSWQVPVIAEKHFGNKVWQSYIRAGAVFDIAVHNNVSVLHYSEACKDLCFANGLLPIINTETTSTHQIGWQTGAGMERKITPHTAVRLEVFGTGRHQYWQGGLAMGIVLFQ